jgi:guanylate kinase
MKIRPAFPLVIAAPSGAGKTTLAQALVARHEDLVFSISATTREPRDYEKPGKHYVFLDDAEFDRMVREGEFLEWAVVHGCRYGTPIEEVRKALRANHIVVLDIDVQGARQIRARFPDAVLVYILPPSAEELVNRLSGRGSEVDLAKRTRLTSARRELPGAREFDYLIVNDDFERANAALEAVVLAERHRQSRFAGLKEMLESLDRQIAEILERSS